MDLVNARDRGPADASDQTGPPDQTDQAGANSTRPGFRIASKAALKRLGILSGAVFVVLLGAWAVLINMPGRSHSGPLPAATDTQLATAERLRRDVEVLAGDHPRRNIYNPLSYALSARYLETRFREAGLEPVREAFELSDGKTTCENIVAEIPGVLPGSGTLVIGAHYDSYSFTPGADDNA